MLFCGRWLASLSEICNKVLLHTHCSSKKAQLGSSCTLQLYSSAEHINTYQASAWNTHIQTAMKDVHAHRQMQDTMHCVCKSSLTDTTAGSCNTIYTGMRQHHACLPSQRMLAELSPQSPAWAGTQANHHCAYSSRQACDKDHD